MPDSTTRTSRPLTGDEYLESLRDGREVYVYGERVKDVTTHPAFRNSARSIARLYDALHDDRNRDVLTTETDTGSGGRTHKFFRFPRSAEDCVGDLGAIAAVGAAELRVARAAAPITRRRSWRRSAQTPTSTSPTRRTQALVPRSTGDGALLEPRDHPSARGSQPLA